MEASIHSFHICIGHAEDVIKSCKKTGGEGGTHHSLHCSTGYESLMRVEEWWHSSALMRPATSPGRPLLCLDYGRQHKTNRQ